MSVEAAGVLLIVDDEPVVAAGLARLFERRGYHVVTAHSAENALRVIRTRHIDGMILDFRMPDMRGDIAHAAAVALQPHLATRTVFLTGDISPSVEEALSGTRCPVVLKPFDLADFERVVREMISKPPDIASGEAATGS
jgi:CheY-like chemotaxis protein